MKYAIMTILLASTAYAQQASQPPRRFTMQDAIEKAREDDRRAAEARKQLLQQQTEKVRQELQARRDAEETAKAAKAEDEAKDDAMRANPIAMSGIYGASVCLLRIRRTVAIKEIANQKKYAQLGGVQDNASLYYLQNSVRKTDEELEKIRAELKGRKDLKPFACNHIAVKALLACYADSNTQGCEDERLTRAVTFLPAKESAEE